MKSEIDIVVLWVDGSDQNWVDSYNHHKSLSSPLSSSMDIERYRDMNTFRFFFRAVEKYAPWVRKIHLVTNGVFPDWINKHDEKINLVRHEDFIPAAYLPTFNSHTIELNIHRIQGLSDKFIYFNDDMFLNSSVDSEYFFSGGLPVDSFILSPNTNNNLNSYPFYSVLHNNTSIINKHFSKNTVIKNHFSKFLNINYGMMSLIKNIASMPWASFIGFRFLHQPQPFLKKTYEKIWSVEGEYLDGCCRNKFRAGDQVNQYVIRHWQLVTGDFSPMDTSKVSRFYNVSTLNIDDVITDLLSSKIKTICINDSCDLDGFDEVTEKLITTFDLKFPNKSSFEM